MFMQVAEINGHSQVSTRTSPNDCKIIGAKILMCQCTSSEAYECDRNVLGTNTEESYICRCFKISRRGRDCTGNFCKKKKKSVLILSQIRAIARKLADG